MEGNETSPKAHTGMQSITGQALAEQQQDRRGKHGKGRYAYATGNIYEGEFEASLKHGYGKYAFADGGSYEDAKKM